MASLQARHTRACAIGKPWTPAAVAADGCTCQPSFYVAIREGRKLHRERVGKNRRQAERALTAVQAKVDADEYQPLRHITFEAWADQWHASLRRPKENTRRGYSSTLGYAKQAFGHRPVRRIGVVDVDRLLALLAAEKVGPSTQRKHLRVLGACLREAVRRGYASRNPIDALHESQRPQAERREAAYFTDAELPRLLAAMTPGVYRTLAAVAVRTGARQGELLALTWDDIDLVNGTLHVRRSITDGILGTPKNRRARDVEVGPSVVKLLGAWWGELGHPDGTTLVFPGETASGFINPQTLVRRELRPAMNRAGISKEGPTGEKRNWHSLRHTFARIALENGRQITWLSRHLGHSSLSVTEGVYGHWSKEAAKAEIAELETAFGV